MVSVNPIGVSEDNHNNKSSKIKQDLKRIEVFEPNQATNANAAGDVAPNNEQPKVLSANDLDCRSFGKKYMARAKDIAREAIEDVNKEIRKCNSKFGTFGMNTLPDIPDPAKYTRKGYGSKAEAFHAWSEEVKIWKNGILDELENLQAQSQETQHQQEMKAIYQLWARLGVTEQMLSIYCEQTNQSIESLRHVTVEKSTEIMQFVNNKVDNATYNINNHIETHVTENNFNTNPAQSTENASEVDDATAVGESKLDTPEADLRSLKEQVYLSWNNDQNLTKRALDNVLKSQGKEYERTHFTDGSQIESAAATSGLIDNLDAETLQAVLDEVERIKAKRVDIAKHGLIGSNLGLVGVVTEAAKNVGEKVGETTKN